jgi:ESX secretion system protein EccC
VTRLAFHRPARLTSSPLPEGKITLPAPPVVQSGSTAGGWVALLLAKITAAWAGEPAPPVRLLPERLPMPELLAMRRPHHGVPIGIGELDLQAVCLDLVNGDPHLVVFGDAGSGNTAFLHTWLGALVQRYTAWEVRVVLVDYRRALLGTVPEAHLGAFAGDSTTAGGYLDSVVAKLRERMPPPDITPARLRARDWWEGPDIYVVVDDYDLVGGVPGQQSPLAPLTEFIPHARDLGLHIVVTRRVVGGTRLMSDQAMSRIRELGCAGLVLSGDPKEGVLMSDGRAAQRPPGRGVLLRRGQPKLLIHVALDEDEDAFAASAGGGL